MIKLCVGDEIPLENAKVGNTNGHEWMMIVIKPEKGYDSIGVFVDNIAEAKTFTSAKIAKILEVCKTAKKYGEKYYDNYTIHCTVEGVDGNAALKSAGFNRFQSAVNAVTKQSGGDFMAMPDDLSGDDLPFN